MPDQIGERAPYSAHEITRELGVLFPVLLPGDGAATRVFSEGATVVTGVAPGGAGHSRYGFPGRPG